MSEIERLDKAKAKVDGIVERKNRLMGELSTRQAREKEIRVKCKEEFDCDVSELSELANDLRKTGMELLDNVETLLE